jgi:hypothetical protein
MTNPRVGAADGQLSVGIDNPPPERTGETGAPEVLEAEVAGG